MIFNKLVILIVDHITIPKRIAELNARSVLQSLNTDRDWAVTKISSSFLKQLLFPASAARDSGVHIVLIYIVLLFVRHSSPVQLEDTVCDDNISIFRLFDRFLPALCEDI